MVNPWLDTLVSEKYKRPDVYSGSVYSNLYNAQADETEQAVRAIRPEYQRIVSQSADPNGMTERAIGEALLSSYGVDADKAHAIMQYSPSVLSGTDAEKKSYGSAVLSRIKESYWIDTRGIDFGTYVLTGDPFWLDKAKWDDAQALKNRVTGSYGQIGDFVLEGVQPIESMGSFVVNGLAVAGSNAALAYLTGGASLPATAVGGLTSIVNLVKSGGSQMGNTMWDIAQATDSQGNTIDLTSPFARGVFAIGALHQGGIEIAGAELIPGYKSIMNGIAGKPVRNILNQSLGKILRTYGAEYLNGITGEAIEELLQEFVGDIGTNALYAYENKNKDADFDMVSFKDMLSQGGNAMVQAAKGMVTAGAVTGGIGASVEYASRRINALKYFNGEAQATDESGNPKPAKEKYIDARYISGVQETESNKEAIAKKVEEIRSGKKQDPVTLIPAGAKVLPATKEDAATIAAVKKAGGKVIAANVQQLVETADTHGLTAALASQFEAEVLDGNDSTVIFANKDDVEVAAAWIGYANPYAYEKTDVPGGIDVKILDGGGKSVTLKLRVADSSMQTHPVMLGTDMDEANMDQMALLPRGMAQAFKERSMVRDIVKERMQGNAPTTIDIDKSGKTKGVRFSETTAINETVNSIIMLSEATGIPSTEIARKHVSLSFDTDEDLMQTLDKVAVEELHLQRGSDPYKRYIAENVGNRGYKTESKRADGERAYTIHVTRNADRSTIIHETGHILRAMATREQLDGFRVAYGEDGILWMDDLVRVNNGEWKLGNKTFKGENAEQMAKALARANEERFADDFVAYCIYGTAPNEQLRGVFQRMKSFLRNFINRYSDRLSDETVNAFNRLFDGEKGESRFSAANDSILMQNAEDTPSMAEVRRKYEGTYQWMKAPNGERSNLSERQWLQVRTPEFKTWFGDWENDPENASKVVDENGEPLVEYHGTGERFTMFDRSLIGENTSNDGIWGKGFYFTPDMDLAQEYAEGTESPDAHVEGTFLKMVEPYEMDQKVLDTSFSDAELAAAKDAREKAEGDPDSPYALLSYSMEDAQLVDMYRKISQGERLDGVIYHGEEDLRGYNRDEYVVPDSSQIKSATDNNGAFDSGNSSILFQRQFEDKFRKEYQDVELSAIGTDQWMKAPNGERTRLTEEQWITVRTSSFKTWFGDWENGEVSGILDDDGEPMVMYHGTDSGWFDTFDRARIGSRSGVGRGAFAFTSNREKAEAYSRSRRSFAFQERVSALNRILAKYDSNDLRREYNDTGADGYDAIEIDPSMLGEGSMNNEEELDYLFRLFKGIAKKIGKPEMADEIDAIAPKASFSKVYQVFIGRKGVSVSQVDATMTTYNEAAWSNPASEGVIARIDLDDGNTVAFVSNPGYIKSATDNNGNFSTASDSILFQMAEKADRANEELAGNDKESIVEIDGTKFLKDDPGYDYNPNTLRGLKEDVSRTLFQIDQKGEEADGLVSGEAGLRPQDVREGVAGRANATSLRLLRRGLAKYFDWNRGWNGLEPQIDILGQWDRLGFVSFIGTRIKDASDLAKLFSIYRNPKLEYFHIAFTKGDKIVGQLAMSSGLPGRSYAVPYNNLGYVKARMGELGADGYYLLHNHPSGNVTESPEDVGLTKRYKMRVPGFRGHIIMDHNRYNLLTYDSNGSFYTPDYEDTSGFHQIPEVPGPSLNSPSKVAKAAATLVSDEMKDKVVAIYVNSAFRVVGTEILDEFPSMDEEKKSLFSQKAAALFYATGSGDKFHRKAERVYANEGVRYEVDALYLEDDGSYQALTNYLADNGIEGRVISWQGSYENNLEAITPKWDKAESSGTLFQRKDTSVEANPDGTLTVLHTLPASRIADIARIGGMPMPSLAITRSLRPITAT